MTKSLELVDIGLGKFEQKFNQALIESGQTLTPPAEWEDEDNVTKEGKKKKKLRANNDDYFQLCQSIAGALRRDIFSGKLSYFEDREKLWNPAINLKDEIAHQARIKSIVGPLEYNPATIKGFLDTLERRTEKELLLDLPKWDGKDRLKELCSKVKLSEGQIVSSNTFEEIVKTWCANLFRKLADPSMNTSPAREFILILCGPQAIGKDYWIRSLLCGMNQWFNNFLVSHNDRDVYMQLHEGLVLNISEFDRTAKLHPGLVKDLTTEFRTKLRAAYDPASKTRYSYSSIIGSCNTTDVFRDTSGNSRFVLIELDDIERGYVKNEEYSLQCLAQSKQLASENYCYSAKAWKEISRSQEELTPEDFNETTADIWHEEANKFLDAEIRQRDFALFSELSEAQFMPNAIANGVIETVAKRVGITPRQVRNSLSSRRLLGKYQNNRGVYFAFVDIRTLTQVSDTSVQKNTMDF